MRLACNAADILQTENLAVVDAPLNGDRAYGMKEGGRASGDTAYHLRFHGGHAAVVGAADDFSVCRNLDPLAVFILQRIAVFILRVGVACRDIAADAADIGNKGLPVHGDAAVVDAVPERSLVYIAHNAAASRKNVRIADFDGCVVDKPLARTGQRAADAAHVAGDILRRDAAREGAVRKDTAPYITGHAAAAMHMIHDETAGHVAVFHHGTRA